MVLLFRQRHFLFLIFDRKIQQLLEAHVIGYYIKIDNEECNVKFHETFVPSFKVLTFGELKAGFVVSVAPLIMGLVVFCSEWTVRLKDLLVVLSISKTFFKIKHIEQDR